MKKLLLILLIIGLSLGGAAAWLSRPGESRKVDFTTTPVEYGNLLEAINATGILQPHEIAVVTGDVPGKVIDILAHINQHVKKGQPLLKLDEREASLRLRAAEITENLARSKLKQAKAQRDAALQAYNKAKSLGPDVEPEEDKIKSQALFRAADAQVEEANLSIEKAQQAVKGAKLALDVTTINSPIDGTIIDKKVYLGQPVGIAAAHSAPSAGKGATESVGGPLFVIAHDLRDMDVHAQVIEGDIAKVRPGQEATFRPYAYSNRTTPFPAKVAEIHQMPTNIQGAVLYDVVLRAKNEKDPKTGEWMLRPGMTSTVDIVRREHRNVWKAPVAALDFQLDEHYQSPEARAKIAKWKQLPDRDDWQHVWIQRPDGQPWPVFVKTNAADSNGDLTGISDGQFKEIVEWDPDLQTPPDPKDRDSYPKVIIAAPQWQKPGLFDQPTKFKFS